MNQQILQTLVNDLTARLDRFLRERSGYFGHQLRNARRDKKLSAEDLGQLVGVTGSHISSVECGHARVSMEVLVRLCDILGTRPDVLLGYDEKTNDI